MKNLINRFFAFANISYTMFTVRSNVRDGRKSPQIKPSAIFLSLILMVLFKKRSFLKLDQFMRTDAPKRFLGRDKRVAVSDTTISRSLSTYFLGEFNIVKLQDRGYVYILWRVEYTGY